MSDFIYEKNRLVSIHFPSLHDFIAYKLEPGAERVNGRRYKQALAQGIFHRSRDGYGPTNRSASDVLDHAVTGDDVLTRKVIQLGKQLDEVTNKNTLDYTQRIQHVKRRKVRKHFGDELDIHRVYQGQLDTAWGTTERVVIDETHNLITLFIDIGGNAGVTAESSLWRTAVVVRLVNELEAAGKSVKICVGGASVNTYVRKHCTSTVSVVVKDFNQALSIERLAAMSHIGFYRVFGFAAKMCYGDKVTQGLGQSESIRRNVPIPLQQEIDEGHTRYVYIDKSTGVRAACSSLEDCYRQMKKYSEESA